MIDYFGNPYGGSEGQLSHILRRLDRSCFQPFLCCLWAIPRTQVYDAIPFEHVVLFPRPVRWVSAFFSVIRIRNLIREKNFDIVHTLFPTSNVLGVLAARLASVQAIVSSRRDLGYWKSWRDKILLRAVRHIPTCYLANSHAVKRQVAITERIDPDKIVVVHSGIDACAYGGDFRMQAAAIKSKYRVAEDTFVVGVVANCRPVKGVRYFVEAAKLVAAKVKNVRFFVVGEAEQDEEERLRNRIHQLHLDEHFVFTGGQEDVRPFLSLFHVGVLSSLSEGFSSALLEYMAAGVPPVVTDVGGNRELVADGRSGFLVKPASPQALAEKIVLLLSDARLRERIARNAKRVVETQFSIETMIGAMERFYEGLSRPGAFQKGPF